MLRVVLLLLSLEAVTGFSVAPQSACQGSSSALRLSAADISSKNQNNINQAAGGLSRRGALQSIAAGLTTASILTNVPAFADVSDGNALPEGAAQFTRIVRAKTDMQNVAKRVSSAANEMDKTEWQNVGGFLRKVYGVADNDMKAVASGLTPDKKKTAAELMDKLKKTARAADATCSADKATEFLAYGKTIESALDAFLDLLSDVPDEL